MMDSFEEQMAAGEYFQAYRHFGHPQRWEAAMRYAWQHSEANRTDQAVYYLMEALTLLSGREPGERIKLWCTVAWVYARGDNFVKAQWAFTQADAEMKLDPQPVRRSYILGYQAQVALIQEEPFDEAMDLLFEAIELTTSQDTDEARCQELSLMLYQVVLYLEQRRPRQANVALERALELVGTHGTPDQLRQARELSDQVLKLGVAPKLRAATG